MEIKTIANAKNYEGEVLVINMFEGEKTSQEIANEWAIEKDKFEGKFLTTYLLHTYGKIPAAKVLIIGMGKRDEFTENKMREIGAKAIRKLSQIKAKSACFDFEGIDLDWGNSAVEGAGIADYRFDKYKSKKDDDRLQELFLPEGKFCSKGEKFAKAMTFARDLINDSAQVSTPTKLAEIAGGLEGLQVKVYDRQACEEMGMGAYLAVARGSDQPPKFIHMKYSVDAPTKKIAVVGKGITFDSGGLDLKPASSMLDMKDDMSGAACVLAVMGALKEFSPNVEVHGIIAACENMPSGKAYKPGDILTAKNGKTIEVDNTDAEGRLTLADALCYACELGVDEVIDLATLTGACMVALGTLAAGVMGNDDAMQKRIIETAERSGERFWQLPMYEEYKDSLKSDIADMKNTGSRYGGASTAGVFLKEFVKNVKWTHLDIAGTAYLDKAQKEFSKGATGAGVRTILNYILNLSEKISQ